MHFIACILFSVFCVSSVVASVAGAQSLAPRKYAEVPVGSIAPSGWLLKQLEIQREGLTGHLALFWDLKKTGQDGIADSVWIGGSGGLHEETPYWLNGAVPLAYLLRAAGSSGHGDDYPLESFDGTPPMPQDLMGQVHTYLDYILDHQVPSGWMGPDDAPDDGNTYWCRYNLLHSLHQYAEAEPSRFENITSSMLRLHMEGKTKLHQWSEYRYQDLVLAIQWMLDHAPQGHESELFSYGFDWETWFKNWTGGDSEKPMNSHGVNNAQALKSSAVLWRLDPQQSHVEDSVERMKRMDELLGVPTGLFIADEIFETESPSRHPSRGTETCTVVESMFSYNTMFSVHGLVEFADRAEQIAINALPACFKGGALWAHQYLQQVNEINAKICDPHVWKHDGPNSIVYGLNGGCCTANFNQGWPKFATHIFYTTQDGGAAVGLLMPATVNLTSVGGGSRITVETDYPFDDLVTVKVSAKSQFPLYLRIPGWPNSAVFTVNGGPWNEATRGEMEKIDIPSGNTTVVLDLKPSIYLNKWDNGSVSVHRGPLMFSIPIGESVKMTHHYAYEANDYTMDPTTEWRYALVYNASKPIDDQLEYHQDGYKPGVPHFHYSFQSIVEGYAPFNVTSPPCYISAEVRKVRGWEVALSAADWPPASPACAEKDSCDPPIKMNFVPHGSTDLRIGEFPLA